MPGRKSRAANRMNRKSRRRGLFFFALIAGIGAACSFPEVTFGPASQAEAGVDSNGSSTITDAHADSVTDTGASSQDAAGTLPPDVDPDGGAYDATTRDDATAPLP